MTRQNRAVREGKLIKRNWSDDILSKFEGKTVHSEIHIPNNKKEVPIDNCEFCGKPLDISHAEAGCDLFNDGIDGISHSTLLSSLSGGQGAGAGFNLTSPHLPQFNSLQLDQQLNFLSGAPNDSARINFLAQNGISNITDWLGNASNAVIGGFSQTWIDAQIATGTLIDDLTSSVQGSSTTSPATTYSTTAPTAAEPTSSKPSPSLFTGL